MRPVIWPTEMIYITIPVASCLPFSVFEMLIASVFGLIIVVPAAIVDGHDHLHDHDSHKIL